VNVLFWGSTAAERASHFPCDDLPFESDVALYRAIGVAAAPALTFRWLAQLRAAPYSYDLIDNFGRPSPTRLTPGLDALAPGQRIMTIFRIASVEPGRSITVTLDSRLYEGAFGGLVGSYRVDPAPAGSRLVAKILLRYPKGAYGTLLRTVLPTLDLIMFRKQLLNLKRLAERDAVAMRYRTGLASIEPLQSSERY
jgi:hypothetical protein